MIEGIPKNPLLALFLFGWLALYLTFIAIKGTNLNIFEFYTLTLIPILIIVSARGAQFFKALGFSLNNAPAHIIALRFIIAGIIGWFCGSIVYNIAKSSIFPADSLVMSVFLSYSPFENILATFVIAFHEEIIRIVGMLIFFNYFIEKTKNYRFSLFLAVLISSLLFVANHFYAWGRAILTYLIPMTLVVIFFTVSGFILTEETFGKLGIKTFTIWIPLFAHMSYDFHVLMNLTVYGIPTQLTILPSYI